MSANWWDEPAPEPTNAAGHTDAQIDSITAQAIAAEPAAKPATPAKLTPEQKLASYLLPQEAPVACIPTDGPRGMIVLCRTERHAEAVSEAAAVAGLRVEPWTLGAVATVLKGGTGAPVARVAEAFPGSMVRRSKPRQMPDDEIPFGRWEMEAAE